MKIILSFLALASLSLAEPAKEDRNSLLVTAPIKYPSIGETWLPTTLTLCAGKGAIVINLKTGQVELPKDMTLPDAAVAFWMRVAQAFPECRRAMLTGDPTPATAEYQKDNTTIWRQNGKNYEFGLRSDGVVVWREIK